jgi:DNA-binding NtrC family response regulator
MDKNQNKSRQPLQTDIIGDSELIKKLHRDIAKIARADAPVLISGDSGTGKELIARAIHRNNLQRAEHPFVVVNCGAIPAELIEPELFGHIKGAFTGAEKSTIGRIASADGGTLFLDEIADLPLSHQVKLLRFLQEGSIDPVGSHRSKQVDVRVVAASHIKLEDAVNAGKFREDLFFRLNVLNLHSPRLAERKGDIEALAYHYLKLFLSSTVSSARAFSDDALIALKCHSWSGNVRELMNRIQKALVMCDGHLIEPEDLGLDSPPHRTNAEVIDLESVRKAAERKALKDALDHAGNNISKAARALSVSRMTLYRLLNKHKLRV